jgi:putative flippase GtrA
LITNNRWIAAIIDADRWNRRTSEMGSRLRDLVNGATSSTDGAMRAQLLRLMTQLPPQARRFATPARIVTLVQFLMFGTVGVVGFVADTATVYLLRYSLGLYGAGVVAYGVAATVTWILNRVWTFRGQGSGPAHRQWARFLRVNLAGFVLNRGTYAALITFVSICASEPVLAVGAGAIVGMFLNFSLSRTMVFR